jgi:hypothetical protein
MSVRDALLVVITKSDAKSALQLASMPLFCGLGQQWLDKQIRGTIWVTWFNIEELRTLLTPHMYTSRAILSWATFHTCLSTGSSEGILMKFDIKEFPKLYRHFSVSINPLKTEFIHNFIYKFSLYVTGNTLRLRYKDQPVNAVWGKSRCLLWEPYGTHRCTLWAECRVLVS